MPLYEFKCEKCGEIFERIQKFTDPLPGDCSFLKPDCPEKSSVKKLISQTSFHLKGGGWYTDGYGSKSSAAVGGTAPSTSTKESTGSSEAPTSASSSAEKSKPETTTAKPPSPPKPSKD